MKFKVVLCSCYIIIMRALRYIDVWSLVRSLHYTDTKSFSFCKTCYDNKNNSKTCFKYLISDNC